MCLHVTYRTFPLRYIKFDCQTMRARGQFPTQHTAGAFLDALKLDGQADRCVAVYNEMVDGDVDLGCVCFNIVVSALVQVQTS